MDTIVKSAARHLAEVGLIVAVVVFFAACGFIFGAYIAPVMHSRNFPWIIARATGLGAFAALTALLLFGLWFRRHAGRRARAAHPETLLRFHAALAPAVVALLAVHIISLLADRWSGVTLRSVLVPFVAHYRPGAVGAGTLATELLLVVTVTAALAGRPGVRARWAPLHRLAYPAFGLAWAHGLLAGSDTPALLVLYIAAGLAVAAFALPVLLRWGMSDGPARDQAAQAVVR